MTFKAKREWFQVLRTALAGLWPGALGQSTVRGVHFRGQDDCCHPAPHDESDR